MKKCILTGLVFFLTVSLFAQSRQDISIFISPTTGEGSSPEDLAYFDEMTAMEVPARGFAVGETKKVSDYSLVGSVSKYDMLYEDEELGEDEEPVEYEEDDYYSFHIALIDNETDFIMVEQDLIYQELAEVNEVFPLLLFNMLANIPLSKLTYDDDWRNKWFYIGFGVNWSPRVYSGDNMSTYLASFGLGFLAELHFLNFMSVEAGLEINEDAVAFWSGMVRGLVAEIPVMVKFVLKPSLHYMLEPYVGIQLNAPTNSEVQPDILSWLIGFQFGVRAGPGVVFIDSRFIMDLGKSSISQTSSAQSFNYQRTVIKMAVGYKYGFFVRNRKSE